MCIVAKAILAAECPGNAVLGDACAKTTVSKLSDTPNLIGSASRRIFQIRWSGTGNVKERNMGNPAGDKFKKRVKRRKKFETRLEGLAYVSKEVREAIKKAIATAKK